MTAQLRLTSKGGQEPDFDPASLRSLLCPPTLPAWSSFSSQTPLDRR